MKGTIVDRYFSMNLLSQSQLDLLVNQVVEEAEMTNEHFGIKIF